jgi:hypothetical protein
LECQWVGLRQRSVLAALLLDAAPTKPVASLRAYVANLRRILGEVRLVTEAKGYRLHMGGHRLDTREFESLISDGRRRIFAPLYYALLSDVEAAHRDSGAARASLRQAEQVAKATGGKVWDTQLSARKLTLRADSVRSDAMRA